MLVKLDLLKKCKHVFENEKQFFVFNVPVKTPGVCWQIVCVRKHAWKEDRSPLYEGIPQKFFAVESHKNASFQPDVITFNPILIFPPFTEYQF
jgi:hypothetical protein